MAIKKEWYSDKLKMFSAAVAVGAGLFDENGELIMLTDAGDGFCSFARSCEECRRRGIQFHADAGREAYRLGEAYIARCPLGAVVITAPIVKGGRLQGSAAFMPMRMWAWDAEARGELRQSLEGLSLDYSRMQAAGEQLPEIDIPRSKALMELIMETVGRDSDELELNRLMGSQQRRISEMIGEQKQDGESFRVYPIHIEREMLSRVRFGDRKGARALLNELLGHIFFRAPGNMKLMKARVLELVVVISRAAVESGAEMEALLGLNYDFVAELSAVNDYEELCAWVVRMLEKFLDTASQSQQAPGSSQLSEALTYIRSNYMHNLTLDAVAEQAHVSPYYLSHLFRERLGVTFVEYVTGVRMETAKSYLIHTRLPVSAIAERLGYDDPGYFGKVFRKYAGMTPLAYRRSSL